MGVGINTGLTSVTGNVSVSIGGNLPGYSYGTPITEELTANGNTQTIYTVPANKIFLLMGFQVTYAGTAGGTFYKTDGVTRVGRAWTTSSYPTATTICPFVVATYAAGEFVKGNSSNTSIMRIYGVLVDA